MRVIFTHDITDEAGRLAIGTTGNEPGLMCAVEDAAVHRFQPITHIGEGAGNDHRHGIVEVGGLHLLDDGDRRNVAILDGRRCAGQCHVPDCVWCCAWGAIWMETGLANETHLRHPVRARARVSRCGRHQRRVNRQRRSSLSAGWNA